MPLENVTNWNVTHCLSQYQTCDLYKGHQEQRKCSDTCPPSLISASSPHRSKSTFKMRVQRLPPAHKDHTGICQSSLSFGSRLQHWTMFKAEESVCLWREIRILGASRWPSITKIMSNQIFDNTSLSFLNSILPFLCLSRFSFALSFRLQRSSQGFKTRTFILIVYDKQITTNKTDKKRLDALLLLNPA